MTSDAEEFVTVAGLDGEVDQSRQNIRSDTYMMSIGEVLNLYSDNEIIIRPEFQRLFRWPIEKQSRLIESLLLGIPLPPIFVAQRQDGVWEVVDGLQRLSTILKFTGDLQDAETKEVYQPSELVKTKYLPSLEGATFDSLSQSLRIAFKRARLDFKILLRESDDSLRFELFDRLNSGGIPTSAQEVRTAQLLMLDSTFYQFIVDLRKLPSFDSCVALTDRQIEEQYDLELVIRYLVLSRSSTAALRSFSDIDTFFTDRILQMGQDPEFNREQITREFDRIFSVLSAVGPESFRKFDSGRGKPVGAFSVSAYEATTLGIAENLADWERLGRDDREAKIRDRIAELWSDSEFGRNSGAGVRATQRSPKMHSIGSRIFRA